MRTYEQYRSDGHTPTTAFILSISPIQLAIGAACVGLFFGLFIF